VAIAAASDFGTKGKFAGWGAIFRYTRVLEQPTWYDQYVPPVVNSIVMSRQSPPFVVYTVPPGSGNQIRTVPVGGTNRITVNFSEDVAPSATVLVSGIDADYLTFQTWVTPRILRIDIPAPIQRGGNIPGDKLTLTIENVKKLGATGANLDGDWVNPNSLTDTNPNLHSYPSGDGNPGTSFVFRIAVQPGDYNLDNKVDLTDFAIQKDNYGKTSGATYAQGDADGDGDIDLSDFNTYKANVGVNWASW
jgi:hypothetical protein